MKKKLVTSCKNNTCGCCAYCPTYKKEECTDECMEVPDLCDGVITYDLIDEETWARQFAGGK